MKNGDLFPSGCLYRTARKNIMAMDAVADHGAGLRAVVNARTERKRKPERRKNCFKSNRE